MRAIVRTSRNTGVSTGPLGLIVLAIGGLLYVMAIAIIFAATMLAAGVMIAIGEIRRRRAAPHVAARRG